MISPSTIAAASRVIEYAAARPIALCAGLMPPSTGVAPEIEAGVDPRCIGDALDVVDTVLGANGMTRPSFGLLKSA
jgi:hypothetical protein